MFISHFKKNLLIAITSGLFLAGTTQAALNKWIDKKGQVHYGDRVPSEYINKEHSLLNEQGVTIRTTEKQKSDKELSDEEKQRSQQALKNRTQLIASRKKALRDRVLLDTFTSEKDLSLARDARIDAIDSQISLAQTLIEHDEIKLKKAQHRINEIEKSQRAVPLNLFKDVTSVSRSIENNYAYIEDKSNERVEIITTFKQDLKSFRELMKENRRKQSLKTNQQHNY